MRVVALVRAETRLQFRHGYYAALGFVVLSFSAMLRLLPEGARALALPPVLLTEAAVVGFFFAGTLLHLERTAGTLDALAMSPVRLSEFLLARALSLSLLNALAAVGIAVGAGAGGVVPAVLVPAAALTGAVFTLAGLALAARLQALERFVVWGGLATSLGGLPVLGWLGWVESPLWWLLPAKPALSLLAAGSSAPADGRAVLLHMLLICAWLAAAYVLARRWLRRYGAGWGGAVG